MSRKHLILVILVVVLAASATYCWLYYPRQKTVAKLKYTPGTRATSERRREIQAPSRDKVSDEKKIRFDLLEQKPAAFTGYRRDIFKPIFEDKQMMLARKAAEAEARARKAAQKARKVVVKPPPVPAGIQQELGSFKLIGFLQKDGKKTVFLDKGGEVTAVRQGTTFSGRFTATSLTEQALIIKVAGTGEEVIIPLIDAQATRTAGYR